MLLLRTASGAFSPALVVFARSQPDRAGWRFAAPLGPRGPDPSQGDRPWPALTPHKAAGVREAIEAVSAKLRYCRRIRPDLNPIELVSRKPPSEVGCCCYAPRPAPSAPRWSYSPDLNPIELVGGSPLHLVRADQIRPKEIGPGQLSRSGCGGRAPPLGSGANQQREPLGEFLVHRIHRTPPLV